MASSKENYEERVLTFRGTPAVQKAVVEQRERLERRGIPGVNITQTDAIASLVLAGDLLEQAANDPSLQDEQGFTYFSVRQIVAEGLRACRAQLNRLAAYQPEESTDE